MCIGWLELVSCHAIGSYKAIHSVGAWCCCKTYSKYDSNGFGFECFRHSNLPATLFAEFCRPCAIFCLEILHVKPPFMHLSVRSLRLQHIWQLSRTRYTKGLYSFLFHLNSRNLVANHEGLFYPEMLRFLVMRICRVCTYRMEYPVADWFVFGAVFGVLG